MRYSRPHLHFWAMEKNAMQTFVNRMAHVCFIHGIDFLNLVKKDELGAKEVVELKANLVLVEPPPTTYDTIRTVLVRKMSCLGQMIRTTWPGFGEMWESRKLQRTFFLARQFIIWQELLFWKIEKIVAVLRKIQRSQNLIARRTKVCICGR